LSILGLTLAAGAGVLANKADEANAKKLIGTWEVVKSEQALPGATIEFTNDGKMNMVAELKGKAIKQAGTYKIKGNKILIVQTFGGKEHLETITIQNLTDTALVTRDEKGKVNEFRRKK
jgi:uncharacterized protein (TIGR03066 family)